VNLLERQANLIGDHGAAVNVAMSCSIALRRSPKPGAFTAASLRMPRMLLTNQRRERLALDVLSDHDQRTARSSRPPQEREHLAVFEIFLSHKRINGFSNSAV